ncbi:MAG: hypothetical protein NTW21_13680 [Verrucomicrobia bacterium]|nr:hypothetical protein [Verrucomicrobiota bacterium]
MPILAGAVIYGIIGSEADLNTAGFAILATPVICSVLGYGFGRWAAEIYNRVAKRKGGLEFEVRDVPPAA